MFRVCVSILPKTFTELKRLMNRAEDCHPDFIEIRFDRLSDERAVRAATNLSKIPKVATFRSLSIRERRARSLTAAESGYEFVDLDLRDSDLETTRAVRRSGARLIVSFHDYRSTPPDQVLSRVLSSAVSWKADICKLVTMARTLRDSARILCFLAKASTRARLISFAMGKHGQLSRVLCPLFGSYFTFASLDSGAATAPGQLDVGRLREIWRVLGFA